MIFLRRRRMDPLRWQNGYVGLLCFICALFLVLLHWICRKNSTLILYILICPGFFFIRFSTFLIVKLHWIAYKCTNVVFFLKNFFLLNFFINFLRIKKPTFDTNLWSKVHVWRMLRTARKCPFRSCPIEYLICPYNCKDFPNIYF